MGFWDKIIKADKKRLMIEETKKRIEAVVQKFNSIVPPPAVEGQPSEFTQDQKEQRSSIEKEKSDLEQ